MVTQIRAISERTSQNMAQIFRERAAEIRSRAALKIADEIINQSPVDTGTYIMAHVAGQGATPEIADRTSRRKERGQPWQQFANLARGNLHRSVSAQAIESSSEIWFRNRAVHAGLVEYVHGYLVYTSARARAPQLIRVAAQEVGMETR